MKRKLLLLVTVFAMLILFSVSAAAAEDNSLDPQKADAAAAVFSQLSQTLANSDIKANNDAPVLPATTSAGGFTDISGHWAKSYIDYVVNKGLFNGMSDTTFAPNTKMSRAMFVTVLGRFCGVDEAAYQGSSFYDVPAGKWYSAYVSWAVQNNLVSGFPEGDFRPDASITREQMATLIYRFCNYRAIDPMIITENYSFRDSASINSYAVEGILFCQLTGILNGQSHNNFAPKGNATRAEVATVLYRLDQVANGQRLYLNYPDTSVPTYSSVTLSNNFLATMLNQDDFTETYDLNNGIGFVYIYSDIEFNTYFSYLTAQGFYLEDLRSDNNIEAYVFIKGSSVMGIGINRQVSPNLVVVLPDTLKL